MRGIEERPVGLHYEAELLSRPEEQRLLALMERTEFREVRMRGQVARRTVRHFGFTYDYETWDVVPADPMPPDLDDVRARCAQLADLPPEQLAQVLVSRYPPGATIGWHRDASAFGPAVVGVSLGAACVMRFQRGSGAARRVYEQALDPRSAYVLAGSARSAWQHSIPAVPGLRYSITFRTLRRPARQPGGQPHPAPPPGPGRPPPG
jgi:alkylated DNA repair dioxygenase AlkB